ncbi:MAG: MCP four helix bundle domain-containing protein, partial [Deltaproteobacteria bacterium]|nr:MCP four helix bundle domain-containing protein [Deltaproteobacteria bacterium]
MELTIFKRLTIGYLAIMVVVVFLGVYVTFKLSQLDRITHAVISVESTGIRLAEGLVEGLFSERGFEKKYMVSKDEDFFKQFMKVQAQFAKDLKDLEQVMDTPEKKRLLARVKRWHEAYGMTMQQEFEFISAGRQYPYETVQQEKEKAVEEINRGLRDTIRVARQDRDAKLKASSEISSRVSKITAVTAAAVIVMGILISFFNTRSINRPIHLLQEKTKEISAGRFEEMRGISSPPEIKELVQAFNLMCERLQELDEMKADFISHVSHELRTPLTAVKEASSMLLEGGFRDSPDKQEALLQIINEECERLIRSVNRILDLSSMEARMTHYFFRDCSLTEIIEEAVSKFTPMSLRNGIALEMHLDGNLPTVRADGDRVGQILENLLGNALKFTSRGGKVVVRAKPSGKTPGFAEVCVADTGCGIAGKDIEKIFDKFHRIDTGKETAGGTGLGLAIAKHIVAAHKGDIWVESEPGKGS